MIQGQIYSDSVTALTTGTIRFIIKTPASGYYTLWQATGTDPNKITFETNVIAYYTGSDQSNSYKYTIPVSVSTWYDFAMNMTFNVEGTVPVMYLNGVKQTVTTETSGGHWENMQNGEWIVGDYASNSPYIGGFAWWNAKLSDENMEKLTRARRHDMPLYMTTNLVNYVPLDDFPVNEYLSYSQTIVPDADVQNTFSAGNYASLAADDTNYLVIDKFDDIETGIFSYGTFTIPNGFSCFGSKLSLTGMKEEYNVANTPPPPTVSLTKGGGTNTSDWSVPLTLSMATYTNTENSTWTQTDVDGVKINITSGTMPNKSQSKIDIDYTPLTIYYRRHAITTRYGSIGFYTISNDSNIPLSVGYSGSGGY